MTDSKTRSRGRPRSFDDDAVLGAGMDLFWRTGYGAASMPEVARATGLSTSSVYNAYGSKLGFFVATLDCYLEHVMGAMVGPLEHGDAGLADVDAFLARLEATLALDPPRGCLAVNTIAEFRDPPPPVAERTARYRALLRRAVHAALERAAAAGEIPPETVADRTAALVPMVIAFNLLAAARAPAQEARDLLRGARAVAVGALGAG
jgi:TetR/AcrR family transcriptional repressor of nem operon